MLVTQNYQSQMYRPQSYAKQANAAPQQPNTQVAFGGWRTDTIAALCIIGMSAAGGALIQRRTNEKDEATFLNKEQMNAAFNKADQADGKEDNRASISNIFDDMRNEAVDEKEKQKLLDKLAKIHMKQEELRKTEEQYKGQLNRAEEK